MTEPTDGPRLRPRPRARVAGQRQKAAAKLAQSAETAGGSEPSTGAAADAAATTAAKKAAERSGTRRPAPPRTEATRAAVVQAAAAKAAAARSAASKAGRASSVAAEPAATTAKRSATGKAAARHSSSAGVASPTKATSRLTAVGDTSKKATTSTKPAAKAATLAATPRRLQRRAQRRSRVSLVLVVLSVLTVLAAVAVTLLVVQRVNTPPGLDPELLPAAADAYSAMYTFDYTDPDGSTAASLAVLTGDLRTQFEQDLNDQVVQSYLDVSATTRVDNITVGLQAINDEQTQAVVIAYGTFVVKSVNSGQQASPAGSECAVTDDGADACVQTLQLNLDKVDGTWLVSAVTTLTTS